jgi:plasmid stabilization system protein ParE
MAHRIVLRPQVPDDLHNIVQYLEEHSIPAADRFIEAVFSALDGLAEMPGKGSPKQLRIASLKGLRSWAVPRFRKYPDPVHDHG